MSNYKLRIFSDLHYDKYPDINDLFEKLDFYYQNVDKDKEILILAGDIGISTEKNENGELKITQGYSQVLKYLKSRWNRIILVAGNHEYYTSGSDSYTTSTFSEVNNLISNECEKYMIDFLNKDMIEINGFTFMGCTLWSDMNKDLFYKLNDKNWNFTNYEELIETHNNHKEWIEKNLEKFNQRHKSSEKVYENKVIVITHYLPTFSLLHNKYMNGKYAKTTSAYVCDLDNLIEKYDFLVPVWICGHSHMTRYSRIGKTFLFNCPIGNPWESDNYIFQDTIDLLE
jgi:UDP-2,3-diacylglucosamine pyrophosphatase LpxH